MQKAKVPVSVYEEMMDLSSARFTLTQSLSSWDRLVQRDSINRDVRWYRSPAGPYGDTASCANSDNMKQVQNVKIIHIMSELR